MKSKLFFHFFLFLFGFVSGNLFPTFFGDFSSFLLLVLLESFNFLVSTDSVFQPFRLLPKYSRNTLNTATFSASFTDSKLPKLSSENISKFFEKVFMKRNNPFHSIKIGFLFGLFVDAFKVGS